MANATGTGYPNLGPLPLGVPVLAILIGVFGFFVLLTGVLLLVLGTGFAFGSGSITVFGSGGTVAGLILLVVGLLTLGVASGLWDQELWALALAVIVLLFYGLLEYVSHAWFGFLVAVVLLIYLVAVSSHFD